ncbi:MAG TPA: hypothetical protein VF183_00890 [Acidimicrobiales bacterium]
MSPGAQRRGALAAMAVGVAVVVLYVALQPGERPQRQATVSTSPTTTTGAPTTSRDPVEELCALAREFADSARGLDLAATARLAEEFYERGAQLAPPDVRPEYEAAVRYYAEYNDIGELYGYDLFAALASPDGQRWSTLTFNEPLGVPVARANVAILCGVELPPPPTITTTTTTRPRPTTTQPPETSEPAQTSPPSSAPATTAPTQPTTPG